MTTSCLRVAATVLVWAVTIAGCAPKTAPAPPSGAARFPGFLYPAPPAELAALPAAARHQLGWQWLQAGDLEAAQRNFSGALKEHGAFYPAEAGLGYVALADKDNKKAVTHFQRALKAAPDYVPALVGIGEAQLALGRRDEALASFEAAVKGDPQLASVRSRVEVLRFRGLQEDVAVARKAAEAGRIDDARTAYHRAIAASPESPFLYRELAAIERQQGNFAAARQHAEKAAQLDPTDARALVLLGDIAEAEGDFNRAAELFTAAVALEPSDALDARIDDLRAKAAFAAMPEEYRTIETSPTVTRAQLAALLGVRLDDLLKRSRRRNAVVITDTRGNWAATWILAVARAGIMEVYPNHTFQPHALVRRADLAAAASNALLQIAAENPRLGAEWRTARRRFPDVSPGHLRYPAASMAVEAGVMATDPDGSFHLSRPVTGAEAIAAVGRIEALSERR